MEPIKILIVEDDEDINRLLCKYLEREGYLVTGAFSGTEARLIMSMNRFQLILMDLMLPGMTGEVLIPEIVEKYQTPIIVITAKSNLEDKVKLLKIGADDYITKPFEREEVVARVAAILRRSYGVKKKEYLDIIKKRAKVLQGFIQDFYELSRIEGDDYPLVWERIAVQSTILEAAVAYYNEFERRNIQVELELQELPSFIVADHISFHRIINNLLQNALKYTMRLGSCSV